MEEITIWNVETNICDRIDNYYFKNEENARAKFNEFVKEHNLEVKNNRGKDRGITVRIGKIAFED